MEDQGVGGERTPPVPKVNDAFTPEGVPLDQETWAKRTKAFVNELLWAVEAKRRME